MMKGATGILAMRGADAPELEVRASSYPPRIFPLLRSSKMAYRLHSADAGC